ncbi:MAG: PD-(D/E)XK nuclease family protein, partial [Verrucomicrobia bacterium]|nr:PD-(D/E)XK nuclease family protein [Verrucomicrobiota bacterium]
MRLHFLLGPAGSGKTIRCLSEIRAALTASPEGAPLVLLAPKQATYQLERQLLAEPALAGYCRLHILAFDRLAHLVLTSLRRPPPRLLSEEGRVMVLRALLTRQREHLRQFRASARLPGFASQLSELLREFQRYHWSPAVLDKLVQDLPADRPLANKLRDFSRLFEAYRAWLRAAGLQDADHLLDVAVEALGELPSPEPAATGVPGDDPSLTPSRMGAGGNQSPTGFRLAGLWLDGFAEMTPQELDLLAVVARCSDTVTLAFCLDRLPEETESPLSPWATVAQTFRRCRHRLEAVTGTDSAVEMLPRQPERGRFAGNPVLQHLEAAWANSRARPAAVPDGGEVPCATETGASPLRVVACPHPEAEATFAAREILRFVREEGGRFRDVAVLLRTFEGYHDVLRREFNRYQVPFFLDRREPIAHHPVAELTRGAARIAAFGWRHDDWFGALKTGLVHDDEAEIDGLENEALARGWDGEVWCEPLTGAGEQAAVRRSERLRQKLVPPFRHFTARLATHGGRLTGAQLAEAVTGLWAALEVPRRLETWSARSGAGPAALLPDPVHATVWQQMQDWLRNLALAFAEEALSMTEWLPILEAGLAGLSVGAIPPVLDQVLIGTLDRTRNPDLQMALVLGVNESVFPAPPPPSQLLTEFEREQLAWRSLELGPRPLEALGRERYYGYIAWTRARRKLRITFSQRDGNERPLNPSPFITRLLRLWPALRLESMPQRRRWQDCEHACELVAPWLAGEVPGTDRGDLAPGLEAGPALDELRARLARFAAGYRPAVLEPAAVEPLYGSRLETSVSRLEQFAACPFRFFVHSGLRAEERRRFELDARERGSFQHEVLAEFHRQLRAEEKGWRDLTPDEARARMGRIGAALATTFRDGLLRAGAGGAFTARSLTSALQEFVETVIGWMPQYRFDPHAVELGFGAPGDSVPAWELELGNGQRLALRGKIDR